MKRITIKLFAFVLTLLVGVALTMSWWRARVIPYCEVARHADQYHEEIVRVRATLVFDSVGAHIFEDCDPVSALASSVELADVRDLSTEMQAYLTQLVAASETESIKKVEAIIEGRFNAKFSTGCWTPAFQLTATNIKLLSPVYDYKPATLDGDKVQLRIKH